MVLYRKMLLLTLEEMEEHGRTLSCRLFHGDVYGLLMGSERATITRRDEK